MEEKTLMQLTKIINKMFNFDGCKENVQFQKVDQLENVIQEELHPGYGDKNKQDAYDSLRKNGWKVNVNENEG